MPRLAPVLTLAIVLAACAGDSHGPGGKAPTSCLASDAGIAATTLAVGQVKVVAGDALDCVRLVGGSDYLAVVGNAGRGKEVAAEGFRLGADFGSLGASADVMHASSLRSDGARTNDVAANDVHERLMVEARKLDVVAGRAARTAQASVQVAPGVRGAIFPAGITPAVGTSASVRVPSLKAGEAPCDKFSTINATVRRVTQRAIIMVDDAAPTSGFTDTDLQAIGDEFDNLIYGTDVAYFGSGSDEDANGKIVMLYTPEVNKATPRNSTSLLAGFFWAGDLFPRTSCNQSNASELFYLLVPDPTGIHSSPRSVADVREKTRGTIAHEFQHMLNAGWKLSNGDEFEAVWLDEAMAHFAEEVVGRAKLGVGDFAELTHARIFDVGNGLKDYNAFFFQNLARFDDWLRAPDAKAPMSAQADTSLAVRGAAWALLRYTVDHYSGGDARAFMRAFVESPNDTGVKNIQARVGGAARLDSVIAGWMIANYADNLAVPNLAPQSQYSSWNMRDAVAGAINSSYPLSTQQLSQSADVTGTLRSGGAARYFSVPAGGRPVALQVTSGNGSTVGFPNARLVLLRLN